MLATGPPLALTVPTIAGNQAYGQVLTESHGTYLNPATSYSYQWERCTSTGVSCVQILGATAQTYTLTLLDIGATIVVSETATNAQGAGTAVASSPTAVIEGLGKVALSKLKIKKAKTSATVSCTGATFQICSGTLTVTVVEHFHGHKLTAVSAKKKKKSKKPKNTTRTVTLGHASYSLNAAAHKTLTITLSSTGKKLLAAHGGKLKVKLGVVPTGATSQSHAKTVTLES